MTRDGFVEFLNDAYVEDMPILPWKRRVTQEDREDQQAEDRARAAAPRFEFPQRVTEDITQVVNAANQATTASTQATTAATGVARAAAQVIQDIPTQTPVAKKISGRTVPKQYQEGCHCFP